MARRKKDPSGAVRRVCQVCGKILGKLTEREWRARKPIHELSERHKLAVEAAR
jgi:hypothetical protein